MASDAALASDISRLTVASDESGEQGLQALLAERERQRQGLLNLLDKQEEEEADGGAGGGASRDVFQYSGPPSHHPSSTTTPSSIVSSAPDDDLIPPHFPFSSDPSLRDISVSLFHLFLTLQTSTYLSSTLSSTDPDWEEMLLSLWDFPDSIVSVGEVKLERIDPVSEDERKAVNEEVRGFVETQRRGVVKEVVDKARGKVCQLARLETQVVIGQMILEIGSIEDPTTTPIIDPETKSKQTASLLTSKINQHILDRKSQLSPSEREWVHGKVVDLHGRLRWEKVKLGEIKRPE